MRCIWLALNIIAATPYGPMMTASPGHRTGWRRMCYSVRRRARGARERGQAGRYSTLKGGDVAHISAARDRAARDRADAGHHFARIGRDRVPRHSGIYVIGQKFYLQNSPMPGQQTWLQQAIASPAVDGILIDLDWTDVASPTATKTYSWTLLDSMAQLAIAQGKKFEIAIITGGTTPSWVFTPQPQGIGAAFSNFEYVQADKPGATCINCIS